MAASSTALISSLQIRFLVGRRARGSSAGTARIRLATLRGYALQSPASSGANVQGYIAFLRTSSFMTLIGKP